VVFKGTDRPVERVSWNDAQQFCQRLSQMTGKQFRLPTEAEWEYAARAGKTTEYSFGDDEKLLDQYAWFSSNSGNQTHTVGQKQRNQFGLYDMYGNVWEWVQDVWHDNYEGAPVNGSAWLSGGDSGRRVLRGGSWGYDADYCRSAFRVFNLPAIVNDLGFRVVVSARTQ
ncbi:MAG: formylglycine-generating enzyme family protein, partial [Acidobacteria bacterium]|nr:formylglycine-generating enzyme family protein [Acidobacteriota bacterium]